LSQALSGKGEHELSTYDSNFNVAHVKSFNDSIDTAEANLDVEEVVRAGSPTAISYSSFHGTTVYSLATNSRPWLQACSGRVQP